MCETALLQLRFIPIPFPPNIFSTKIWGISRMYSIHIPFCVLYMYLFLRESVRSYVCVWIHIFWFQLGGFSLSVLCFQRIEEWKWHDAKRFGVYKSIDYLNSRTTIEHVHNNYLPTCNINSNVRYWIGLLSQFGKVFPTNDMFYKSWSSTAYCAYDFFLFFLSLMKSMMKIDFDCSSCFCSWTARRYRFFDHCMIQRQHREKARKKT